MPKVSVIIPIYNVEKYLARCLDSVLAQTFQDFEVICVNDGSTDKSLEILQRYAQKDNRIKVLTQENKGQGVARNRALDIAQGDYIYFVDSDDFIHQQTLDVLVNVAEKTGLDVVALDRFNRLSRNEKFIQFIDLANLKYTIQNFPLKHLLSNIWSSSIIWNKIYRRNILENRRFIEGIYFEDWPFVTCLFADLEKYATVPYSLYSYNDLTSSTVRSSFTVKKIDDYATGIEFTDSYFNLPQYQNMKRTVQKKRIVPSLKMMINKTRREKTGQPELSRHLLAVYRRLKNKKMFRMRDLSPKLIIRIFVLKMKNLG